MIATSSTKTSRESSTTAGLPYEAGKGVWSGQGNPHMTLLSRRGLHVLDEDASTGAGALHGRRVDAELLRPALRGVGDLRLFRLVLLGLGRGFGEVAVCAIRRLGGHEAPVLVVVVAFRVIRAGVWCVQPLFDEVQDLPVVFGLVLAQRADGFGELLILLAELL